jgi:hypothetical protein
MQLVPLANSYVQVADFKAMPSDYDLTGYQDPQLADLLTRASGAANALMKRNLLAQQRTEVFDGEGSNILTLGTSPIIYVRQMQFIQPGITGFVVPTNRVLIDGRKGHIITYSPLELQGVGFVSIFPAGIGFSVTYGVGYGYNPTAAPAWTSQDAPATIGGLLPGQYTIGITTTTQWGETTPNYQTVTTATGAVQLTLQQALGAWKYRLFLVAGAMTTTTAAITAGGSSSTFTVANASGFAVGKKVVLDPLNVAATETVTITAIVGSTVTTTACANAHATGVQVVPQTSLVGEIPATTFGGEAIMGTISSLVPTPGTFPENAPTSDTSGVPLPENIREATRLLALSMLFEQNNLANRGVAGTASGRKRTQWRSTEGTSGKGVPTLWQQAVVLLESKKLSSFFGK